MNPPPVARLKLPLATLSNSVANIESPSRSVSFDSIPKLSGTVSVEFLTRPYASSRPTGRSFTGEILIITVTVSEYRYESVMTYVKLSSPL